MLAHACRCQVGSFRSAQQGHAGINALPVSQNGHRARSASSFICRSGKGRESVSDFVMPRIASVIAAGVVAAGVLAPGAMARLESVNRPDLLPKGEVVSVIDVAGFLAPSEEERARSVIDKLEKDTGFKLRVLAQSYPETPGLAVRDYWSVDGNTVVFVADPTFKNMLNFNVGDSLDLEVPTSFWSRLSGKFGNKFFWQEKGEAAAIMNTVDSIDACLREESGRSKCSKLADLEDGR